MAEIVGDDTVDPAIAGERLKSISPEQQAGLLARYADRGSLRELVLEEVVEPSVIASFSLSEALFNFDAIKAEIEGPNSGRVQTRGAAGRGRGHGDSLSQLA